MSDNIYQKYNINLSKLKRDYLHFPLKRLFQKTGGIELETPHKEDLEYLYITLNIPMKNIAHYLNVGETTLRKWFRKFNIRKDYKLSHTLIKQTKLERYGNENYNNIEKKPTNQIRKIW